MKISPPIIYFATLAITIGLLIFISGLEYKAFFWAYNATAIAALLPEAIFYSSEDQARRNQKLRALLGGYATPLALQFIGFGISTWA